MSETIFTNEMEVLFKFYGKRDDEILVEIQPKIINSIDVQIEIPPQNTLTSIYDLVEAPLVSIINHPIEDTFVTSDTPYNAMNYGGNKSMLVGRDIRGLHQSLVKFNLEHVPTNINIKSARLRMYYSYLDEFKDLALYLARDDWSETSATYLNRPRVKRFVSNEYTVNADESYIEFNVSNEVFEWIKGIDNYGFILSSETMTTTFRTRESSYSPTLLIDYKEIPTHQSTYSKKNVELTVRSVEKDDIGVELEVHSDFSLDYIPIELYVHQRDDLLNDDIDVELIVTREEVLVEIQPIFNNSDEVDVEISVGASMINDIPIEIVIPQYSDSDEIDVEISIQREDTDSIGVELEVANPIHTYDEIDVEISVQIHEMSNINVELNVPQYDDENDVEVDIEVYKEIHDESSIDVDIIIPQYESEDDINVELSVQLVSQSIINVELEIPQYEANDSIEIDLYVQGYNNSDISIELEVPIYNEYNDVNVELGVVGYYHDLIDVKLEVPQYESINQIPVELSVQRNSDDKVDVELEVASYANDEDINVEIGVSDYSLSSIDVELEVPAYESNNDIMVEIGVIDYNQSNINVDVTPRFSSHDDIGVDLEVHSDNNYDDVSVVIEVPLYSSEDEIQIDIYPRVILVDDIYVEITVPYTEGMDEILVEVEANKYIRKVKTFVYII